MNTPIEMVQGFENIGIRFYLCADGLPKMRVPANITLTPAEIEQLKGMKQAIFTAITRGEVLA